MLNNEWNAFIWERGWLLHFLLCSGDVESVKRCENWATQLLICTFTVLFAFIVKALLLDAKIIEYSSD